MESIYKPGFGRILSFLNFCGILFFFIFSTSAVPAGEKIYVKGNEPIQINNVTQPEILGVNIANDSTGVELLPTINSSNISLPNSGIAPETVNNSAVKLYQVDGENLIDIPAVVGTSAGLDVISLTPKEKLLSNTTYKFVVTSALKDQNGIPFVPFSSFFTTGGGENEYSGPIAFINSATVAQGGNGFTSLVIGPDGKLYGLSSDGFIKRWTIDHETGLLTDEQPIPTIVNKEVGPRLSVGLVFDPDAKADSLIAWVSHTTYGFNDQPDFQGKISRLSGPNLEEIQDYVVHLPRSRKDHVTNSIKFGPDGALYILQGASTAMGAFDKAWKRNEALLSAALLRLDVRRIEAQNIALPIDAKTEEGGSYNPYLPDAPLTFYATGIRNAYDMVWHSNGQLYIPTNGSAGLANAPGSDPASTNYVEPQYTTYTGVPVPYVDGIPTQNDYVFRVVEGGYYGHPNPRRAQYVLNGGNPVNSQWPEAVVSQYPVGTEPDPDYKGYSVNLGPNKSPNGVIEYKSSSFNGELAGKLINVYLTTNEVVVLEPGEGPDYEIARVIEGIPGFTGFNRPLDVVEDTISGNLYISEYQQSIRGGIGKITLLKPTVPPVKENLPGEVKINFQNASAATPEGWLKDFGEPYGERTGEHQGEGMTYGWLKADKTTPLDFTKNGENRGTPSGQPILHTFIKMQADEEGTWGMAIPNGSYEVTVTVGDGLEATGVHHINVEGMNVIDKFVPSKDNGSSSLFTTNTATITVNDGVLNIDAFDGGENTKINSVIIKPVDPEQVPPAVTVNFNEAANTGSYAGSVEISVIADKGESDITVEYTLDNGTETVTEIYDAPFTVDQPGSYTLTVVATDKDNQQNKTTVSTKFTVTGATGTVIALENMTKIPGTDTGFPADDLYTFHRNNNTKNTKGETIRHHDTNVLRIHNKGTNTLTIDEFELSDPAKFKITHIGEAAFTGNEFPVNIKAEDAVDVTIQFIESAGTKGLREETLIIHSNADNAPAFTALLKGVYMEKVESNNEIDAVNIMRAFGFTTSMNGQPRPSSDYPTAAAVDDGSHGDLILSKTFVQADPAQPVRAFQLASFKGPGIATTRLIKESSTTVINGFQFKFGSEWHQSLFPKADNDSDVIAHDFAEAIGEPFRIITDGYPTSGGNPRGLKVDELLGVRVYKVYDRDGKLIPYHYIVIQDYVQNGCGAGSANCDWNDNLFYFTNIKPATDPAVVAALEDVTVDANAALSYNLSTAFDKGYPGNTFTYAATLASGEPLPGWLSLDAATGVLAGTPPAGALPLTIHARAIDANGIEVFDADSTAFQILSGSDDGGGGGEDIWLEAECAAVGENWEVVHNPAASGGSYVTIKSGYNSISAAPEGADNIVSFSFNISKTGVYKTYIRGKVSRSDDDSFWVRIDGNSWFIWNVHPLTDSTFHWREIQGSPFNFTTVGTHTLEIAYREDGPFLDKLYLTSGIDAPEGMGGIDATCPPQEHIYPLAHAGTDTTVYANAEGVAAVTLDGSASQDPDGEIVSYSWSRGEEPLGEGANLTVELSAGTHEITLTVEDDDGLTASDQVMVTVEDTTQIFEAPVAHAGTDTTVYANAEGVAAVTLDGSASQDPDGEIVSYSWSRGEEPLGEGANLTVELSAGTHEITLTVEDDDGLTTSDQVVITVKDASSASFDIWLEAECADTIGFRWTRIENSSASAGAYVTIPSASSNTASSADIILYSFEVAQAGNYTLLARLQASPNEDHVLRVRIDGGEWVLWQINSSSEDFAWTPMEALTMNFDAAGKHTLEIAHQQGEVWLDKLLLSSEATPPTGQGEGAGNCNGNPVIVAVDDELPHHQITIFPNPGNGIFTVRFPENFATDYQLKLSTLEGKSVRVDQVKKTADTVVLDLQREAAGVYILQIITRQKSMIKRIEKF